MALSITCPYDAQLLWHAKVLGAYRSSLEFLVATFLRNEGLTEVAVRERAERDGTTVTEAVRRYAVKVYPELEPLWPERKLTPRQLLAISQRTKNPADVSDHMKVLSVLASMVEDPHNMRTRNVAIRLLAKHGITPTPKD